MTDARRRPTSQVLNWLRDRRDPESPGGTIGLRLRVRELEAEMQEMRLLNRRLAELMDVVEELLVPLSQRDEEKVRQYLASHSTVL